MSDNNVIVGADLRPLAEHDLQHAVASVDGAAVTGDLIEADPADVLAPMSADFDLLVLGFRSDSPLRAALLSGVSGVLVRRAACPLMVVPHVPDREHEVTLVGGVEAPRGEES